MMLRSAILVVVVAAFLAIAKAGAAHPQLSTSEMVASRGGTTFATKCSESCNRYNDYEDDCDDGEGGTCNRCANGTTTINYIDQVGVAGCAGQNFQYGTKDTDCGKTIVLGKCAGVGKCEGGTTSETIFCNNRKVVTNQP